MHSFIFFICLSFFSTNPRDSEGVLKAMYEKNHGKWYGTLTFIQENEFYKSDTLAGISTWYEAIEYPKNFRIDIGDPAEGNGVIFRNDSIYSFKGGEMKKAAPRENELTFLLGGMYFYPFEEVRRKMLDQGYDLSKGFDTLYHGRDTWVIGAESADVELNQLWVDRENYYVVRVVTHKDGRKMDALFENHEPLGEAWIEKKVTFYIQNKLVQIEYYNDCRANVQLDASTFDPKQFSKIHWSKKD